MDGRSPIVSTGEQQQPRASLSPLYVDQSQYLNYFSDTHTATTTTIPSDIHPQPRLYPLRENADARNRDGPVIVADNQRAVFPSFHGRGGGSTAGSDDEDGDDDDLEGGDDPRHVGKSRGRGRGRLRARSTIAAFVLTLFCASIAVVAVTYAISTTHRDNGTVVEAGREEMPRTHLPSPTEQQQQLPTPRERLHVDGDGKTIDGSQVDLGYHHHAAGSKLFPPNEARIPRKLSFRFSMQRGYAATHEDVGRVHTERVPQVGGINGILSTEIIGVEITCVVGAVGEDGAPLRVKRYPWITDSPVSPLPRGDGDDDDDWTAWYRVFSDSTTGSPYLVVSSYFVTDRLYASEQVCNVMFDLA